MSSSSNVPARLFEETSNSSLESNDLSLIADSFQQAADEDAQTLSQFNPQGDGHDKLCYIIPFSWINNFMAYISASSSECSKPPKIENYSLLDKTGKVSTSDGDGDKSKIALPDKANDQLSGSENGKDDQEHERKRQARRERWAKTEIKVREELKNLPLKPNLSHGVDFVFVGRNVWNLLSSKYGFDVAIELEPKYLSDDQNSKKSLVLPLYENNPDSFVPVPECGKWEYNKKDDDIQLISDDDQQLDDLFPGDHSVSNTSDEAPTNDVIILPPSTTARTTGDQLALVSLDENITEKNSEMDLDMSENEQETNGVDKTRKRKRYGSGLGNLGNTCFMNSTLQCLAHTPPLRDYFISGEYLEHLNRDNPLGTGGELASEFADLLNEMWGTKPDKSKQDSYASSRNGYGYNSMSYNSSSPVVYPRNFKYALGKHAEQFIGYDQHDSQELATYLLDALHEDTNRITKKPYVEKPEQGEDETDDFAARKAWELHLKREDSRILENCMGQIKSRVQCPNESCGRVSTTFDPFMYLSVPIPGATDRSLVVTYVPLDPNERMKKIHLTLDKNSIISHVQKKIVETLIKQNSNQDKKSVVSEEDIVLADIWNNEVYSFYSPTYEIDRIRDSDNTYAFQVSSLSQIQAQELPESDYDDEAESPWINTEFRKKNRPKLDPQNIINLNRGNKWEKMLENYMKQPMTLYSLLNSKRSTDDDRTVFLRKMQKFISRCYDCSDCLSKSNAASSPDEPLENEISDSDFEAEMAEEDDKMDGSQHQKNNHSKVESSLDDEDNLSLEEMCAMNSTFSHVNSANDVALFEFCYQKFYQFSRHLIKEKRESLKNGLLVQIVFKRVPPTSSTNSPYTSNHSSVGVENSFCSPLVMRISRNLSVYGLRKLLSHRLSRALKVKGFKAGFQKPEIIADGAKQTEIENVNITNNEVSNGSDNSLTNNDVKKEGIEKNITRHDEPISDNAVDKATAELEIFRRIPLTYDRKSNYSYSSKSHNSYRKLGSLIKPQEVKIGSNNDTIAMPDEDSENDLVGDLVGNQGTIHVHWPSFLFERCFNEVEWEEIDDMSVSDQNGDNNTMDKKTSVKDCISRYCQMEQLEESEMWYCNKCKEHVQAWKQFHLYRTPPILIVHLKRFHFSATTHRRDKIDTYIDFPLKDLDLRSEVMQWNPGEEPIYDCYAVSNHYGGLGGGHYTAYAENDEGEWCHFDDSRLTTGVGEKDVKTSAAYVLYYKRKDVKIMDNAGQSLISRATAIHHLEQNEKEASTMDDMDTEDLSESSNASSSFVEQPPYNDIPVGERFTEVRLNALNPQ